MYLLVFVTLVVALTGIYGEVMAVQTKELYAHQTTAANAMENWHATAVGLARYASLNNPGANGCNLSTAAPAGVALNTCRNIHGNVTVGGNANGMQACGTGASGAGPNNCWTNPPPGYASTPYTFYSVYYQSGGGNYVVTFVTPPTTTTANPLGLVTMPNGTQLGITMGDLMQQINNSSMSIMSYGISNGQNLMTAAVSNGTTMTSIAYPLPTGNVIQTNSVGLITSF